jgi:hypothetical protein
MGFSGNASAILPVKKIANRLPPGLVRLPLAFELIFVHGEPGHRINRVGSAALRTSVGKSRFIRFQFKLFWANGANLDRESHTDSRITNSKTTELDDNDFDDNDKRKQSVVVKVKRWPARHRFHRPIHAVLDGIDGKTVWQSYGAGLKGLSCVWNSLKTQDEKGWFKNGSEEEVRGRSGYPKSSGWNRKGSQGFAAEYQEP